MFWKKHSSQLSDAHCHLLDFEELPEVSIPTICVTTRPEQFCEARKLSKQNSLITAGLGLFPLYIKDETDLHSFLWIGLLCAAVHSISVVFQIIPANWSLELETTDTITHFRNRNIFSSYILFFPPIALFLRSYSFSRISKFGKESLNSLTQL